ncbi:hypothetical protein GGR52DRAFT_574543 [Hypoxylon sp. FL1284]|nr:hypothetical protein GGR52DRAFT_574543 [Hypoxylon sp. FL1284]
MRPSLLLALAATAAASVPKGQRRIYYWFITEWQAGMSHGNPMAPATAYYDFKLSAKLHTFRDLYVPPFAAHCVGAAASDPPSSEFRACELTESDDSYDMSVMARVLPEPDGRAHVAVDYSYTYNDGSGTKNFTVVAEEDWARERPPADFRLRPSEVEVEN